MEDILCSGPATNIAAIIKACEFPGDSFVLVERLPQHVVSDEERQNLLQFGRLNSGIDPTGSISGRVFSRNFELRWQEEGGKYYVVYLGEERNIPRLKKDEKALAGLKKHDTAKSYYLFGENLDDNKLKNMGLKEEPDYYAEVRIPRLLRYPVSKRAQRVQLTVCEYVEEETGRMQFFRFQELEDEREQEK